ncbi:aldehyde dehydrogenase family protein [Acetobacteraceae bacterium KSS8]|uniref:Aldehyde dehydrogenase family protein n=1 Tax=Endosaccharibacter trunci TaxID=2812733 RepID=A0ABT1WDE0_9PROT|nr:aldehyde dehydrogenase family protein [Acetobacteraceae bacterium KSS8]
MSPTLPATGLLIDGVLVEAAAGERFETRNPADGSMLATLPRARDVDVDRAVAAARRALDGPWSRLRPVERQRLILRLADLVERDAAQLAALDTADMGAPIRHTTGAMPLLVALLRFYAGQATALSGETIANSLPMEVATQTVLEPVGVVGAIIPWNGPMWALVWKIGPVLATGCTLVMKTSEDAPLTALRFAELVHEAGVPPGVINILSGHGDAGAALAAHPDVDKISFTGSVETGQSIVRASAGNLKRLTLELGGKSPNIIFADADLDAAADTAVMAAFANCGQICSAGSRLFVQRAALPGVLERIRARTMALRLGHGANPETELGPLASGRQRDRVRRFVALGLEQGATLLQGGDTPTVPGLRDGWFLEPAIFADVGDEMAIATDEIFGPVLSVLTFDTEAEVTMRANRSRYGLGAAVWTRDLGRAMRMSRALKAGSVWINSYNLLDPAVPFGGYRMSGYGRENGAAQLRDYMSIKSVYTAW